MFPVAGRTSLEGRAAGDACTLALGPHIGALRQDRNASPAFGPLACLLSRVTLSHVWQNNALYRILNVPWARVFRFVDCLDAGEYSWSCDPVKYCVRSRFGYEVPIPVPCFVSRHSWCSCTPAGGVWVEGVGYPPLRTSSPVSTHSSGGVYVLKTFWVEVSSSSSSQLLVLVRNAYRNGLSCGKAKHSP